MHAPEALQPAVYAWGGFGCSRSSSSDTRIVCHHSHAARWLIGRKAVATIAAQRTPVRGSYAHSWPR
jgi:hypothetical protein